MSIEKLTDEEKRAVEVGTADRDLRWKALRIIDAHAADRAALVAQVEELTRERDEARAELANDPGHDFMRAEVTRLTREREACQRDAELAAEWKATAEGYAADNRVLATANAKLTEALEAAEGNHQLERADRMHFEARVRELAAPPRAGFDCQPGSPGYCDGCAVCQSPALIDHDRAVLEACAAMKIRYDAKSGDIVVSGDMAVYHAELARRESKRV